LIHPTIRDLFLGLGKHPAFQEALQHLRSAQPGSAISLSGLTLTAKPSYSVLLWQATGRPLLIVTDGSKEAEALTGTIDTFFTCCLRRRAGASASSHWQRSHFRASHPMRRYSKNALGLLRMASQRAPITITPIASALLRCGDPAVLSATGADTYERGRIELSDLTAHLDSIGYERRGLPEMVGDIQFAVASSTSSRRKRRIRCASSCSATRSNRFADSKVESRSSQC
jgi:transcription-repair coupling factor (superfamily II helicase)